jgi:hypothetical protein
MGNRAVAALFLAAIASTDAGEMPTVILYDHGEALVLDAEPSVSLIERCERDVAAADDVLRLAVSDATTRELKQQELVLEVVYPAVRTISSRGRALEISRLLVPLSGNLAGELTTIFYGTAGYRHGPLRRRLSSEELRSLAEAARAATASRRADEH